MLAPNGGNDGSNMGFSLTEGNNSNTNFSIARDDQCTPIPPQQRLNSWTLPKAPETPTKQRRTRHEDHGGQAVTYISSMNSSKRATRHDSRGNATTRKRPCSELSQFSALRLDDPGDTVLFPPHETSMADTLRLGNRGALGPPLTTSSLSMNLQRSSPNRDCVAHGGSNVPFVPFSPDQPDYSQADSEFSAVFNRRILTDYKEVKELGCGSFGRVTLYEEAITGSLVAVKASVTTANREQRQRLVRERAVMSITKGFPHIVQLQDSWEESHGTVFLQMEYCSGGSVAEKAEQKRKVSEQWDERELFIFLGHMALALDALHASNIVHVDFKPDNILIDDLGDYKLSDFGCSVFIGEDGIPRKNFTAVGSRVGNAVGAVPLTSGVSASSLMDTGMLSLPTQLSVVSVEEGDCRYLCTDMLNEKRYLKEGDMFSFGISLFELMSGEPLPFHGARFIELRHRPPLEQLLNRGYSKRLTDLVANLMHPDPTARPTARDVLLFFQLPADIPRLVPLWAGQLPQQGSVGEEPDASLVLDVRVAHAALEVSSRLVDLTRRELYRGSGGVSQYGLRRQGFLDVDDTCTPKTPATVHN
uniref:Putative serine/threonine-protein kinase n=1 Tax=Trypanosoma congolense (strain IL3000) TaxID=1068625 RepID=G0ULG2_TRYCI|nr:putative serine/threonine-protein kinase [Trypanosoma congolense IL3000]